MDSVIIASIGLPGIVLWGFLYGGLLRDIRDPEFALLNLFPVIISGIPAMHAQILIENKTGLLWLGLIVFFIYWTLTVAAYIISYNMIVGQRSKVRIESERREDRRRKRTNRWKYPYERY